MNTILRRCIQLRIPKGVVPVPNARTIVLDTTVYPNVPFVEDIGKPNRNYVISKCPEEWKLVENVLPRELVPEPTHKAQYPSGWKPQGRDDFSDCPYFIQRTRNHMLPVYLKVRQHGIRRHTLIRKIQGDIWKLEEDLRPFLKELHGALPLRLQVNEAAGYICMNGDFVNAIKHWLTERHF